MDMRVSNESYHSLSSNHTKLSSNCNCEECTLTQVFSVQFDYSRKSEDGIRIESFTVYDKDMIDVTDKLNVRDYDTLQVEMQDYVSCRDVWTKEDQQEVDWSSHPDY